MTRLVAYRYARQHEITDRPRHRRGRGLRPGARGPGRRGIRLRQDRFRTRHAFLRARAAFSAASRYFVCQNVSCQ